MAKKTTIISEVQEEQFLGDELEANEGEVGTTATAEPEATEVQPVYLKPEVSAVFDLNWTGGHTMQAGKHGRIDLRALTLEEAERLVKNGFTLLVRKK